MADPPGDAEVRAQYEAYPYPARDPADEAKRLITGSPSHLDEINHYVFAGRLDTRRPFRALIAGGGTGDATIMLAQQLADRGCPAEVVYLDISAASLAIAQARAEARGLANLRFVRGSLDDIGSLAAGPYDYIDCCGVLHHLAEPAAGLAALAGQLGEGGGMGLMLYGALGRTGVYHAQDVLKLIAAGEDDATRLDVARRLIEGLPETNWLARNPHVRDHLDGGDAGLYDLLLHSRDRAYTVLEIGAMVGAAGLAITGFIEPALYDPANFLTDSVLTPRIAALPWLERCAVAELLGGTLKRHVFYVVAKARGTQAVAHPDDRRAVPVLRDADGAAMAAPLRAGGRIKAELDGVALSYPVPPLAAAILAAIDGKRDLGEIQHRAGRAEGRSLNRDEFRTAFDTLYAALGALNVMLIARPPKR